MDALGSPGCLGLGHSVFLCLPGWGVKIGLSTTWPLPVGSYPGTALLQKLPEPDEAVHSALPLHTLSFCIKCKLLFFLRNPVQLLPPEEAVPGLCSSLRALSVP